jgi:4-amino-4-deoxy-L-arabinose transferase-like glycosyltransferase
MHPPSVERLLLTVLLVLLAASLTRLLVVWEAAVQYPYNLDYGEPPIMNTAARLTRGEALYPKEITNYPYTINEHPPLYPVLLAILYKAFGISYVPGRIVALIFSLASALLIGLITFALTGDRWSGPIAGGLFLAFPFVFFWTLLSRNDLMALALSLAGLFVAVRYWERPWSVPVAALLCFLAVFTRLSYLLAAPLAATGWYWIHNRRRAFAFPALLATAVLIGTAALTFITQGGYLYHAFISNMHQTFSFARLGRLTTLVVMIAPVLLWLVIVLVRRAASSGEEAAVFVMLYFLGAGISFATIGKIGAGENYTLELCAALALTSGLALSSLHRSNEEVRLRAALLGVTVLQVVILGVFTRSYSLAIDARLDAYPELARLELLVRAEPDMILIDDQMGMLVTNGR